jgi:hypothetical protein
VEPLRQTSHNFKLIRCSRKNNIAGPVRNPCGKPFGILSRGGKTTVPGTECAIRGQCEIQGYGVTAQKMLGVPRIFSSFGDSYQLGGDVVPETGVVGGLVEPQVLERGVHPGAEARDVGGDGSGGGLGDAAPRQVGAGDVEGGELGQAVDEGGQDLAAVLVAAVLLLGLGNVQVSESAQLADGRDHVVDGRDVVEHQRGEIDQVLGVLEVVQVAAVGQVEVGERGEVPQQQQVEVGLEGGEALEGEPLQRGGQKNEAPVVVLFGELEHAEDVGGEDLGVLADGQRGETRAVLGQVFDAGRRETRTVRNV